MQFLVDVDSLAASPSLVRDMIQEHLDRGGMTAEAYYNPYPFDPRHAVAFVWTVDDVLSVAPDLTPEQAWTVLQMVYKRCEFEDGISAGLVQAMAEELKAEFGWA